MIKEVKRGTASAWVTTPVIAGMGVVFFITALAFMFILSKNTIVGYALILVGIIFFFGASDYQKHVYELVKIRRNPTVLASSENEPDFLADGLALGSAAGIVLGAAFGFYLNNMEQAIGGGLAIGIAVGMIGGFAMQARARKGH